MGGTVPTLKLNHLYMCEYPPIWRRASIARVFEHMGTAHMPRAYPLVCPDLHDGEIWFPVSGAQQAEADVSVGVDVLRWEPGGGRRYDAIDPRGQLKLRTCGECGRETYGTAGRSCSSEEQNTFHTICLLDGVQATIANACSSFQLAMSCTCTGEVRKGNRAGDKKPSCCLFLTSSGWSTLTLRTIEKNMIPFTKRRGALIHVCCT